MTEAIKPNAQNYDENQIQVLEKHYGAKPQPELISPFLLAIQNLNSNS